LVIETLAACGWPVWFDGVTTLHVSVKVAWVWCPCWSEGSRCCWKTRRRLQWQPL